jgi:hypothetical protein
MVRKTLSHDRDIEWGWLSEKLESATAFINHALDFGPMPGAPTCKMALERGYRVTAIGLENICLKHPALEFIQQDINTVTQPGGRFDVIINISTIEHVGLGRYGDPFDPDADIRAMLRLRNWLRLFGRHILTLPVGVDAVIGHYHRVYGDMRLWQLLDGWAILEQKYWRKNDADEWEVCTKEEALAEEPTHLPVESPLYLYYAIGGFVLGG